MTIANANLADDRKFVITGCQRSGTTLVGMLLEAHPLIDFIEENDRAYHVQGKTTFELDISKVEGTAVPADRMMGFKAPRDSHRIDEILATLPEMRFLWVERDIRQVVASMLSLKTGKESWAQRFAPKEISKHIASTNDEKARDLFADIVGNRDERYRSVALSALCWAVKRLQMQAATELIGSHIKCISYDQLVAKPRPELTAILQFLDVPWNDTVLNHTAVIGAEHRPGGADHSRSVDSSSRMKWRHCLQQDDLNIIGEIEKVFGRPTRRKNTPIISPN